MIRKQGQLTMSVVVGLFLQLQFIGISAVAQNYTGTYNNANEMMTDVTGKPIYLQVNYNIDGSPFFPLQYCRAQLYSMAGKQYKNVLVRFNMMEDKLLMKLDDETELVAVTPMRQVVFSDSIQAGGLYKRTFEHNYPAVDGHSLNTWYEVLDTGKLRLLKLRTVTYDDKRYYGQASITRVFTTTESYYVYSDDRMTKIQKGRDVLLRLMGDKRAEMNRFMDEQDLKCRKEDEIIMAIHHYNSLSVTN